MDADVVRSVAEGVHEPQRSGTPMQRLAVAHNLHAALGHTMNLSV